MRRSVEGGEGQCGIHDPLFSRRTVMAEATAAFSTTPPWALARAARVARGRVKEVKDFMLATRKGRGRGGLVTS